MDSSMKMSHILTKLYSQEVLMAYLIIMILTVFN